MVEALNVLWLAIPLGVIFVPRGRWTFIFGLVLLSFLGGSLLLLRGTEESLGPLVLAPIWLFFFCLGLLLRWVFVSRG